MIGSIGLQRKATRRSGSALIAVLIAGIFMVVLVASYLQNSLRQLAESDRATARVVLSALIEAGVEETLWALQTSDFSDWTETGDGYKRRIDDWPGMRMDSTSEVAIRLRLEDEDPVVQLLATMTAGRNVELSRNAEVILERSSPFAFGLEVHDSFSLSGNNIALDSFDSRLGSYDVSNNRADRIVVASSSGEYRSANVGNARIHGILMTGTPDAIEIGPQGGVARFDSSKPAIFDDLALDRPFQRQIPPLDNPISWPGTGSLILGDPTGFFTEEYTVDSLRIRNNETIQVQGPVRIVVRGNVRWQGTLVLEEAGDLEIFFGGNFDSAGGAVINDSRHADRLRIFAVGEDRQRIQIAGNAQFSGIVYAPESELATVGGGVHGRFFGAAVVGALHIGGRYQFHFDEALRERTDLGAVYRVNRWREHAGSTPR